MNCSTRNSRKVKCYPLVVAFTFLLLLSCGGPRRAKEVRAMDKRQAISLVDTLRTDTIHFGKVRAGEVVERTFLLSNTSAEPLVVLATDTSCGCLEMEYSREPLVAGASSQATMIFYSSGYNYFVPRAFYITTSASLTPKKIVVTADME